MISRPIQPVAFALVTLLLVTLLPSPSLAAAILDNLSDLNQTNFDFIVVGGGAGGNAIANRLSENPSWSVLVLEAGKSNRGVLPVAAPGLAPSVAPFTAWDWNFTTLPQTALNSRVLPVSRGFILGGSTELSQYCSCFATVVREINGGYRLYGIYAGPKDDWERYAEITEDEGWSWDKLWPYMMKNERFLPPSDTSQNITGKFDPAVHSYTGINSVSMAAVPRWFDDRIIDTTTELSDEFPFNEDMNTGSPLGVGWVQSTVNNGTRSSSAFSYLGDEFLARPNLHVVVNAHVTRALETIPGSLNFSIVEVTQDGGASFQNLTTSKEIILSAGSIMTPKILLLSGIGNSSTLSELGITSVHDLPSVGANLTEQPFTTNSWTVNSTATFDDIFRNQSVRNEAESQWSSSKTGSLVDPPMPFMVFSRLPDNASIFEQFEDPSAGPTAPHHEMFFFNGFLGVAEPATDNFLSLSTIVLNPFSRGSVTLNSSNPFNPPLIDFQLLSSDYDMFVLRKSIRSSMRFLASSSWDGVVISPPEGLSTVNADEITDDELNGYIQTNALGVFHPVGTAAMTARNAGWGVVDPDLKVKGVSGLRVVDSSVFPVIPAAHTQIPTYLIAERGADLIKDSWNATDGGQM